MKELQKVPRTYKELQTSYDQLYQGWMGQHRNIDQTHKIFKLLQVKPGETLADVGCGMGYLLDIA